MIKNTINQVLEIEQDMRAILIESRELARQIREDAEREARNLLVQAEERAEAEAQQEVAAAKEQIAQIRQQVIAEAQAAAERLLRQARDHMDEAVAYVVAQIAGSERR